MSENEENGVVLSIQESRSIPEGTHSGRVTGLTQRDSKVGPYLDVEIDVLDMEGEQPTVLASLSPGYPAKITTDTWLGQLLERFGVDLSDTGADIDLQEILVGKAVQFETEDEKNESGTFANILKKSVRPHPDYDEADVWGDSSPEDASESDSPDEEEGAEVKEL